MNTWYCVFDDGWWIAAIYSTPNPFSVPPFPTRPPSMYPAFLGSPQRPNSHRGRVVGGHHECSVLLISLTFNDNQENLRAL